MPPPRGRYRYALYDCEFVALTKSFSCTLVTIDKKILSEFPSTAKSFQQFLQ